MMPASLKQVDRICRELKVFLGDQQCGSQLFELSLILREALVNAVVHGCCRDETQEIRVSVQCASRDVIIEVEDPGQGFDWQRYQGLEADLWQDYGRGMMIFRHYASDVIYNDKGNRVTLRKSF